MQIKLTDILNNKNILSPSNYSVVEINTSNTIELRKLVESVDKGIEVGSNNYVEFSLYKYIRTSAFTDYKYSIIEDNNSVLSVSSSAFSNMNLKKGDILIVKDSNVGEVVILDKNYDNYMFSSGVNRLNIKKDKLYIYAIMKNKKFKEQLIAKIPKGATIMHAKDLYLDCLIPYPTNVEVVNYVERLVEIIINKENEIKSKFNKIELLINDELELNQLSIENRDFKYPKISQIMSINRLDTGNYTEEFSLINSMIKNYKNGYFYIEQDKISGGNTPTQRVIDTNNEFKYYWITPSYIYEDGTTDLPYKINCQKNNINENCMLIINRTSKGGVGEYVGISSYYDYEKYGKAQHNQGIYKIKNIPDEQLIFMTCLMNSMKYRKLCANLSMGSKMKELKLNNILSIPFPKFPDEIIKKICNLYYNHLNITENNEFVENSTVWDCKAGILDLFSAVNALKRELNDIIDLLYKGDNISLKYKI